MSDRPDNLNGDERDPFDDLEGPPPPEQIWPPPEETGEHLVGEDELTEFDASEDVTGTRSAHGSAGDYPPTDDSAGVDKDDSWTEHVEEIDKAIGEIRSINGGVADEDDEIAAGGETLLAGSVKRRDGSSAARGPGSTIGCEVREKAIDELGRLWGNIFFSPEHEGPSAVVMTSARSGDGATQIAASLAVIGAEANRELRIALVDFNLRRPEIASLLDIEPSPGLTDVLDGRCSLEDAMRPIKLKNGNHLYVLPSGPLADQPLGLIRSRQVQSLLAQIRERFDQTILDVACANTHPDAQVIGSLVDGAVVVVKAGDTPRETVAEAKKRLDLAGVRCFGLVLNQRSDPIPGLFYHNI